MDNKVDISPTKSVKEDAKVKEKDASQDNSSKETVDKK